MSAVARRRVSRDAAARGSDPAAPSASFIRHLAKV
jgi:hypothetical protein